MPHSNIDLDTYIDLPRLLDPYIDLDTFILSNPFLVHKALTSTYIYIDQTQESISSANYSSHITWCSPPAAFSSPSLKEVKNTSSQRVGGSATFSPFFPFSFFSPFSSSPFSLHSPLTLHSPCFLSSFFSKFFSVFPFFLFSSFSFFSPFYSLFSPFFLFSPFCLLFSFFLRCVCIQTLTN